MVDEAEQTPEEQAAEEAYGFGIADFFCQIFGVSDHPPSSYSGAN